MTEEDAGEMDPSEELCQPQKRAAGGSRTRSWVMRKKYKVNKHISAPL